MAKLMVEEFSFSDADNLAGACSGALRRVKSLSEAAPIGRLFAAISTLNETTQQAQRALHSNDLTAAAAHLSDYASSEAQAPLPLQFKRRG